MRKTTKISIKFCLILALTITLVISPVSASDITTYINNEKIDFPVAPINQNGTTIVPMRVIFEKLGANVEWDGNTKTVTATKDGTTIKLTIDNQIAYKNNQQQSLTVPPQIINGSTFVPLRFVGEALGADVGWDGVTKTININLKEETVIEKNNTQEQENNKKEEGKENLTNIQKDEKGNNIYSNGDYTVLEIIDGNTFKIDFNGVEENIKLLGIEIPYVNEEISKETLDYINQLVNSSRKIATITFDTIQRDENNNLIGYLWFRGTNINENLLLRGFAKNIQSPYNTTSPRTFQKNQEQAKWAGNGMWKFIEE